MKKKKIIQCFFNLIIGIYIYDNITLYIKSNFSNKYFLRQINLGIGIETTNIFYIVTEQNSPFELLKLGKSHNSVINMTI